MAKRKRGGVSGLLTTLAVVGGVAYVFVPDVQGFFRSGLGAIGAAPVAPDWDRIAAWPGAQAAEVEAQPDPNRTYTAIVFDDSGSMSGDIAPARAAVLAALDAMDGSDRIAVVALNRGVVLPFTTVAEARGRLPDILRGVFADGTTPLTAAIANAREALGAEAARAGAFGTYRILVTTDGEADDGDALRREIERLAAETPIQLATIGVGIGRFHVLNRADLGTFVAIDDVSQLAAALQDAIAEQRSFSAITTFGEN